MTSASGGPAQPVMFQTQLDRFQFLGPASSTPTHDRLPTPIPFQGAARAGLRPETGYLEPVLRSVHNFGFRLRRPKTVPGPGVWSGAS